ncbi:hypothetical protein BH18ACT2_BH18ACT2_22660 [soil metagenome]
MTGVLGQPWRADVSEWGGIEPWDGTAGSRLDWHVAADDRWHTPATEVAVRQHRLLGAPVYETRLRVPGGDAVQRVWSVPDDGGLTCVEVTNDSPLPIACAFTRADLLTARPPTTVPIEGIDLPAASTTLLPIGHRSSVTVALGHAAPSPGRLPDRLADAAAVARGWVAMAERASRLDLPEAALGERVVAARCDLLLTGLVDPNDDPVTYLVGVGELVRMGELTDEGLAALVPAVALAAEAVASRQGWEAGAALDGAAVALSAAGERRALADLARITAGRTDSPPSGESRDGLLAVVAVEGRLVRNGVLFPDGIPASWRGANLEAHGLRAGPSTTLSFAVRWHGEHPAVLWEQTGDAVELTAPAVDPTWRTTAKSGEALWRTPR